MKEAYDRMKEEKNCWKRGNKAAIRKKNITLRRTELASLQPETF